MMLELYVYTYSIFVQDSAVLIVLTLKNVTIDWKKKHVVFSSLLINNRL